MPPEGTGLPVESWRTRIMRWRFNRFPAYRRTGARITSIAADLHTVTVRIPFDRRTRNYVGTMFGGVMYAAVDPVYAVMLILLLGRGYQVWDKAASIRYRRPARTALEARFRLAGDELATIRRALEQQPRVDRRYGVELVGADRTVYATVEKVVHVRRV